MNFLNGYKTYLGAAIALIPAIIQEVSSGYALGLPAVSIFGGVIVIVGRYLAQPK